MTDFLQNIREIRSFQHNISIEDYDNNIFKTKGHSGNIYNTTLNSCTCPDFIHRQTVCKHMIFIKNNKVSNNIIDIKDNDKYTCLISLNNCEKKTFKCDNCNKHYHISCINEWFKYKNSCPVCRKKY